MAREGEMKPLISVSEVEKRLQLQQAVSDFSTQLGATTPNPLQSNRRIAANAELPTQLGRLARSAGGAWIDMMEAVLQMCPFANIDQIPPNRHEKLCVSLFLLWEFLGGTLKEARNESVASRVLAHPRVLGSGCPRPPRVAFKPSTPKTRAIARSRLHGQSFG